ncbi:hypothetical protein [Halomicrococcus gelatinilyticus]|uniref:hypothetical protein n=1 Tax=Halomicrococcus gelatinilyticus TaxID=1702103 RepID=UPI002E1011E2
MAESDRPDFGGLWNGLSYIALGLLGMSVFVFYGDSVDTGETIASLALVVIGVAAVLTPRLSPLFTELDRYWTGLFWTLCGLGVIGLGAVASRTASMGVSGAVVGGGLVVYGVLIAFGR